MKWFTFFLVFGSLLLVTETFNVPFSVADETTNDSSQVIDRMEEGYPLDSFLLEDEEVYAEEGESDASYQEEITASDDEEEEGKAEEFEGSSDM